jgi:hypothetical protein
LASESSIEICRPSHKVVDRPISYTVWIDGKDVGAVHDGETRRFSVTPGTHQVRLGIPVLAGGRFWGSTRKEVDARAGDVAHLTCSPKPIRGMVRPRHRLELH